MKKKEAIEYAMVLCHLAYRAELSRGRQLMGGYIKNPLFEKVRRITGHKTGCPCCGKEDLPTLHIS